MKVAFVVQRYGLEVNGGAELHCRLIAEHMSRYWDAEVLTTCAIDYVTWKNEYSPGAEKINGITVRRFPVDSPRTKWRFALAQRGVSFKLRNKYTELWWMKEQGPYSTALFDFIKKEKDGYDLFIFFTYLYCTTFFGLPLVKEKAVLVPTAEDSPPLRYGIFNRIFRAPRAIIYNTVEEKMLVNEIHENSFVPSDIVAVGVDFPEKDPDAGRFRARFNIKDDFIIYIGRITVDKGCGEMFDNFIRYKKERPGGLKLVLMGKAVMEVPLHPDIINLGFVSEEDKFDALKASKFLLMPSPYESLSIVLLESWLAERPVLVNKKCDVMRGQCERSGGGLSYKGYAGFRDAADHLLEDKDAADRLAKAGRTFTVSTYGWDVIERKYLELFKNFEKGMEGAFVSR